MVKELSILSDKTPLYNCIGTRLTQESLQSVESYGAGATVTANAEDGYQLQQTSPVADVANEIGAGSLVSLQQLASMQARVNVLEYQQYVIDYAVEWEEIVTGRIDSQTKDVKKLQQDRLHYEKKVDALRTKVNNTERKGKETPVATMEKLQRNEEKLRDAWENHETAAGRLCVLMQEAIHFGWKDLYPLVTNIMKWEVNRLGRENETYGRLPLTLEAMKADFEENLWRKPEPPSKSLVDEL